MSSEHGRGEQALTQVVSLIYTRYFLCSINVGKKFLLGAVGEGKRYFHTKENLSPKM